MQIPSNYEINVATAPTKDAKYGRFYCQINLGDCSEEKALEKFGFIKQCFPVGWNLTLKRITCYGEEVAK